MVNQRIGDELALYILHDRKLYDQKATPIIKLYAIKYVKGIYDPKKALVGWMSLVDEGWSKFKKEYPGYYPPLDKATKILVAKYLESHYDDEIQDKALKMYDLKKAGKAWQRGTD